MTRTGRADPGCIPPLAQFASRSFAVRSPLVSWLVFERLGGILAYPLARMGLSPSAVTLLGGALGIGGATLLATAADTGGVLSALGVLLLSYVFDCVDGQLARATHRTSALGAWLDVTVDAVVIAFVAASVCVALLGEGSSPVGSVLLAGAYGASRTVSLMTASRVAGERGGIRLTGLGHRLRVGFVAVIDTPVVYVALCASRLTPGIFRAVLVVVTAMTVIQTAVSARHHFVSAVGRGPHTD